MLNKETKNKSKEDLQNELTELQLQLEEANETIEAIRTGQVDALVVQGEQGHQLYTLKSADQTYRVFIEKMTEGALTINDKGFILYSNSQFASMVNQPLNKVIGQSFENYIAPDNKNQYHGLFKEGWVHDCKGEVFILAKSKFIPVQLSLTTLALQDGVSLSIILTDLTNQKLTQQQLKSNNKQLETINKALEESNHDLQQFASVASHDLQEPLRKIQIFTSLLMNKQPDLPPESINYLEKIIDSTNRMKKLIIDILNYSRVSANETQIKKIDVNEIIKELKEDFELIIEEKKAEIVCENLPYVLGNKGQLRQVFQNVLSNSLKFTIDGKAPFIKISSKRVKQKDFDSEEENDGPYCLLTIEDNGIGFDDSFVSNVFALFERLNSKDKYEGTGIGMAIAKKIIEKHNGLITAQSKEGTGANFLIILPV